MCYHTDEVQVRIPFKIQGLFLLKQRNLNERFDNEKFENTVPRENEKQKLNCYRPL